MKRSSTHIAAAAGMLVAAIAAGTVTGKAMAQVGNCSSPLAEAYLDINNVRARIYNNGNLFWRGSPAVYEVPAGGGVNAVFSQAFWFGGLVDGEVRMAAARYGNYEFWAGPIDEVTGLPPSDDCAGFDHIYKISRSDMAMYEGGGAPSPDLANWPTGLGAPTVTSDGQAIDVMSLPLAARIDRTIDLEGGERPDFTGDQMLWWVVNDVGNNHLETDGPPVRIEAHVTAFAFDVPGPLRESTFYRYRIFYRGSERLDSAYVGIFHDVDLGNYYDDYVGMDTTLAMAFSYNADDFDETDRGYGTAPPALALDLVRGPVVDAPGDTAWVGDERLAANTNLELTAFVTSSFNAGVGRDPSTAVHYYRYMQPRWVDGRPVREGNDGIGVDRDAPIVKFMYPGDPVTKSYWSEFDRDGLGSINPLADRRYIVASGPFDMEPGDQQEVVLAIVWARGRDHLDSVTELRRADRAIQAFADVNFDATMPVVEAPALQAVPSHRSMVLSWSNAESSNNAGDAFARYAPVVGSTYHFEGYEVYRFDSATDSVGTRIATYDLDNGVRRVIDKSPYEQLTELAADGTDSGIRHEHIIAGLENHRTYHFGVQAYAYQDGYYPKVIRSVMARVSVEPREGLEAASPEVVLGAIGIVPNPYYAASEYEVSGGKSEVRIVNVPDGSTVRVFTLSGSSIRELRAEGNGSLHWDLRNAAGRRISSGIYLVHVDVPNIGTQVLKFSMVEPAR